MGEKEHQEIKKMLVDAGNAILKVYKSDCFFTELKSDNTPVTLADKASSQILNEGLKKLFPLLPILDEETSIPAYEIRSKWEKYFLIDPLDGTKEFVNKNGEFCINLALIRGSSPEFGWIYQPLTKTGWFCARGRGITEFKKSGEEITLSVPEVTHDTIKIAASRSFFKPREAELIEKIKRRYQVEIIHCGSSKKQIEMIKGNADMYLKAGPCSEWDTAPGQLMVEEFGGVVLRQDTFTPLQYNRRNLKNPHFIMLNKRLNMPSFILFLKEIVESDNNP